MKRAILIVLDGCGAGAAPDVAAYNDIPTVSTVLNVWKAVNGFKAPNLARVGFLAACGIRSRPTLNARYGRLRELSAGKDSVTGHWEMMGEVTHEAFPTYPQGFPKSLVKEFEERIGRKTLANKPASGTEIIKELGAEHIKTGYPILYTSADSVFQLACHEDVVPIKTLYDWCKIARELCVKPNHIQRVIARPFIGSPEVGYTRTGNRRDFPYPAPPNLIDEIQDVYGIGPVPELFGYRGFRKTTRTPHNPEHAQALLQAMDSDARFIFANFEDFDMLYGHRSDAVGFSRALEEFDRFFPEFLAKTSEDDLILITADHGNDPTDVSTDHTREYVPIVVIQHGLAGRNLGTTDGMGQIADAIAHHLGVRDMRYPSLLIM